MTAAETRATMEAYAAALLGGGAYETYFADDIVVTMTGVPGEITGPAAAKAAIDAMHHEQFDAKPELTTLVVGEGTAAAEVMFVGTHTGEFAGIAATGTEVEVPYSVFYELADGKITALRIYALAEGLVQQLQAAPSTSTGAPRSGTLHLTKECSEYTGEAGSFCTIVILELRCDPDRLENRLRRGCHGRRRTGHRHCDQYPQRRHRLRPCGPRWRDTDRHGDAGGWDRAVGEPRRRPRGRPARCTQLQLGRAVLVLGATSAECAKEWRTPRAHASFPHPRARLGVRARRGGVGRPGRDSRLATEQPGDVQRTARPGSVADFWVTSDATYEGCHPTGGGVSGRGIGGVRGRRGGVRAGRAGSPMGRGARAARRRKGLSSCRDCSGPLRLFGRC